MHRLQTKIGSSAEYPIWHPGIGTGLGDRV